MSPRVCRPLVTFCSTRVCLLKPTSCSGYKHGFFPIISSRATGLVTIDREPSLCPRGLPATVTEHRPAGSLPSPLGHWLLQASGQLPRVVSHFSASHSRGPNGPRVAQQATRCCWARGPKVPSFFPSIKVFSNESAKVLEFQLQHHSFQCIFKTDFL